MTGIGTVERLIAKRKISDDIVLDRNFQQRPLKPRRVAQVTACNPALSVDVYPYQNIATEPFAECESFATVDKSMIINFLTEA